MNNNENTTTGTGNAFQIKVLSKETILKMQRTEILEESSKLWTAFCSEKNELFKEHIKKIYNSFAVTANQAIGFRCFRTVE